MEENICTNKYKAKQILLRLLLYTVYISLIGLILGQIQAIADFSYTLHELMYLPVNIAIYIVPIELIVFIYYRIRWRSEIREEQVKIQYWRIKGVLTICLVLFPLCYYIYISNGLHTGGVYSNVSKHQEGNKFFVDIEGKEIRCSKNEYNLIDPEKEFLISFDWNKFFPKKGRLMDIDLINKSKAGKDSDANRLSEPTENISTNEISVHTENQPNSDIQIQSPMTLSSSMCTFNGQSAYLRLKMVKGRYYEDWNPGAFMGTLWEGSFVIELADEYGKTIAETDITKMFSEPLIFKSSFNLEFDDYNNDGDLDFTIGQYGSSNGYYYRIFTLRKDGKVEQLPIKDRSDLFISNRTGNYSTRLNKINGTTFELEYYDNSVPATFHDFYQWDGKQFILNKSQKMTQEDALAGSIQDKNNHYTYVKYGKSEDGYMEFTRAGTKIKGYMEIACINQKNEVEVKKYPFNGTLVNNYISITFPGDTWLNSSKGITWIGNFGSQETFFYAPVDATIDANGFTQLPFNKGTMDDFNSFVLELKGRAQE